MTRICVLSHSVQHSRQIRASISAPSEPGSPTLPAPSRSCPQRAQTTTATRSCYGRTSPKPADPADRPITEDRSAEHVRERYLAERPAIRAPVGAVTEHGARPVGHRSDALQHDVLPVARVADEDDLPDPGGARQGRHDDPVAGAERGFHASACHRYALEQDDLGPGCGQLRDSRRLGAAGLGPDVRDLVDHVEKGLGLAEVKRALDLGALLRRLPAEFGDLGVLLDVLGLEVVAPEDVDVVLGELGPLLFDDDRTGLELLVARRVVLLDDLVARLRFDA